MTRATLSSRPRPRAGFTLIESVMSILIVGLMLVAALNTVGASKVSQSRNAEQTTGPMLAQSLMGEILSQSYEEPTDTPVFGRESESGGNRLDWDDVDDYDGWSASPPQAKDGVVMTDLPDWERQVTVAYVDIWDSNQKVGSENGIKRIDVDVLHHGRSVYRLSALRTTGWPEKDDAEPPLTVLLVVANAASPDTQDVARQSLMEAWGYSVEFIDDDDVQSAFDDAAGRNDVAYISATVNYNSLDTKLKEVTIGVITEESDLGDKIGFANDSLSKSLDEIRVLDTSHYITSFFSSTGYHQLFTSTQPLTMADNPYAPGLTVLADSFNTGTVSNNKPSLLVLETGAELYGGGNAAGRRVQLPWGSTAVDIGALNDDGRTLMKRSIEWAAGMEQP